MATRTPRQPAQGKQLCVVRIGYECELLLPMTKGLQLVELLNHSVLVQDSYRPDGQVTLRDKPQVQLRSIDAGSVLPPKKATDTGADPAPLLGLTR